MIYLDSNATTLISPEVSSRMSELMGMRLANPSSQHGAGRRARSVLESAKESILARVDARMSGMSADMLIVTSGGTEANNLALFGLAAKRPGAVILSAIEHPSVLAAAQVLESSGREVRYLPCNSQGIVELDSLKHWLATEPTNISLVSLMTANNETGVLQPIHLASQLCRQAQVPIHTDAVQAFGKISLSFTDLDVDAMTVTAHKIHGPVGVGALIVRNGLPLTPMMFGGFQQMAIRPGTEQPVLMGGFAKAAELAVANRSARSQLMGNLRDRLQESILERIPNAVAIGAESERLPHTLSVSIQGADRQVLQLGLDQLGVACSTGSACASGSSQPSHVLQAMGLPAPIVNGAIRFSLSYESTESDVDLAVDALVRVAERLGVR